MPDVVPVAMNIQKIHSVAGRKKILKQVRKTMKMNRSTPTSLTWKRQIGRRGQDSALMLIFQYMALMTLADDPLMMVGISTHPAHSGTYINVNLLSSWIDEQKREAPQQQEDAPAIDINTLEGEQRAIFDEYMDAYKKILLNENPPQMLFNIDGTAGCGKTYLIAAICKVFGSWRVFMTNRIRFGFLLHQVLQL
jgi:hypothetical protein